MLTPTAASATAIIGACGYNAADCSSNDLVVQTVDADVDLVSDPNACLNSADTVDLIVSTTVVVQSGSLPEAQARYDIGFYTVLDEAGNQCRRSVFDGSTTSPGVLDTDGDDCGDLSTTALTHTDTFPDIPCTDADNDGWVDPFVLCQSWGNNSDQIGIDGCDVTDVQVGTNPKCECQPFDPQIQVPACGDGIVGNTPGELCDDGNNVDDDFCGNDCLPPVCGDGEVEGGEECDPGNPEGGGQCCNPDTCQFIGECGNGVLECNEVCDDGNQSNEDNCLNTCVDASCGDGYVQAGVEECDDANEVDNDFCDNACHAPICGNGEIEGSEQCDNGKANGFDGICNADCTPVEVPTMGEYGLGALALLLIGAGFVAVRKGNLI